jgi:hypothetical protein
MGITDAVEVLVFLIWQLPHWLLFGCRNSQPGAAEDGLFAKGQPGNAYRPHPTVLRAGSHRLVSRCSAKFGETDPIASEIWLAAQVSK